MEIKLHEEYVDAYLSSQKGAIEKMTPENMYGGEPRITNQQYKIMYISLIKKDIA